MAIIGTGKKFLEYKLPSCTLVSVLQDMANDSLVAKEISDGRQGLLPNEDQPETSTSTSNLGAMLLAHENSEVGTWIQDEFDLLNFQEVVHETEQTPAAMKLKPLKRMRPNGQYEVRYAFPAQKYPKLLVFSKQSGTAQTSLFADGESRLAFRQQPRMLLEGYRNNVRKDTNVGNWCRLASLEEINERGIGHRDFPKKSSPREGESTPRRPAGDNQPEEESQSVVFDPDQEMEATGTKTGSKKSSASSSVLELASGEMITLDDYKNSLPGLDAILYPFKKQQKIEAYQVVTASAGTLEHWIERSCIEEAMMGDGKARELNQIKIHLPKDNGGIGNAHIELVQKAVQTWKPTLVTLKREKRDEIVKHLQLAKVNWVPTTQLNFVVYKIMESLMELSKEGLLASTRSDSIKTFCSVSMPWRQVDSEFSPDSPALPTCDINDRQKERVLQPGSHPSFLRAYSEE